VPLQWVSLKPLEEEYQPPQLIVRDAELAQIKDYVEGQDLNVWVEGKPGLGKTLTCKFYMQDLERERRAKVFFVRADASFKDAVYNAQKYYGLTIPRREICGTRFAEEFTKKFLDAERYVFLIDEPERVWATRDIAGFIHTFYNTMLDLHKKFNIMFVSGRINLKRVERTFPEETISRLRLQSVIFSAYHVPQILAIFKQRLPLVIKDSSQYEDHALVLIAKHTYERAKSDMRQGLLILKHAVQTAGYSITADVAEASIEWGKINWLKDKILKEFSPHTAFILFVTASLSSERNSLVIDCPSVIEAYRKRIKQISQDPVGLTSIYHGFKELASEGLVKQGYETTDRAYQANLTFDEEKERDRILKIGKSINWDERFAGM
jgi:Cdc6-like AAA superfamily ATPase